VGETALLSRFRLLPTPGTPCRSFSLNIGKDSGSSSAQPNGQPGFIILRKQKDTVFFDVERPSTVFSMTVCRTRCDLYLPSWALTRHEVIIKRLHHRSACGGYAVAALLANGESIPYLAPTISSICARRGLAVQSSHADRCDLDLLVVKVVARLDMLASAMLS
jgi:hypothetical protein